jgi:hypothetical protein
MFGRRSRAFVQMYEYGCRNIVLRGLDVAFDQMKRRVRLCNRFVEIEKETRQRARMLLSDHAEYREIHELRERVSVLRAEIQQRRTTGGRNAPGIEDLRKQVLEFKAALGTLTARAKMHKRDRFMRSKGALKVLHEDRARKVKQAQQESGLYWCNYDDVRHTYEVARVRAMRAGTELREHDWNGSGHLSVRFQRGLPVPRPSLAVAAGCRSIPYPRKLGLPSQGARAGDCREPGCAFGSLLPWSSYPSGSKFPW